MDSIVNKEVSNGIAYLTLNHPRSLNAFSGQMLLDLAALIDHCNCDQDVKAIVLTGNGKFFTSGNDQKNLLKWIGKPATEAKVEIDSFVDKVDTLCVSLINNKKPLIIGVNGPAVGIGVTILGQADFVIASKSAFFVAPFSRVGIGLEMCSSYTFPKMIGHLNAKRMLMFSQKVSVNEALALGFVSKVIATDETDESKMKDSDEGIQTAFQVKLRETVEELMSSLSNDGLVSIKRLMSESETEELHKVQKRESTLLRESLGRPEVEQYAMKFLTKK